MMKQYFDKAERKLAKYRLCYLQNSKKAALKFIWWNLCYLFSSSKYMSLKNISSFCDDKQHIAITFAGGIGDYFFAAKYVEALAKYLSDRCVIDVLCEERDIKVITAIFYGKDYVNNVLSEKTKTQYDLHIRLVRFPEVLFCDEKRLDERTIRYVKILEDFYSENQLMIKNDYMGRCWSMMKGRKRENQADIDNILNMSELDFTVNLTGDENKVLSKFGLEKQKFITLQAGAGIHFHKVHNEVRQWPIEYYSELAAALKKKYPEYKVIQLGSKYQEACLNVDKDLRGETSICELLVLLKYAKLHISQEGGMVIIRHFIKGGKSVVLFGPTDERFVGFEENVNLSHRACEGCCEWLVNDWMKKCVKTGGVAECMKKLTPDLAVKYIDKELL